MRRRLLQATFYAVPDQERLAVGSRPPVVLADLAPSAKLVGGWHQEPRLAKGRRWPSRHVEPAAYYPRVPSRDPVSYAACRSSWRIDDFVLSAA